VVGLDCNAGSVPISLSQSEFAFGLRTSVAMTSRPIRASEASTAAWTLQQLREYQRLSHRIRPSLGLRWRVWRRVIARRRAATPWDWPSASPRAVPTPEAPLLACNERLENVTACDYTDQGPALHECR